MTNMPRSLSFDMLSGSNKCYTHDVLDEIYGSILNDFNSRICENCKHHRYVEKFHDYCDILEIVTSDSFGCNLFEGRT